MLIDAWSDGSTESLTHDLALTSTLQVFFFEFSFSCRAKYVFANPGMTQHYVWNGNPPWKIEFFWYGLKWLFHNIIGFFCWQWHGPFTKHKRFASNDLFAYSRHFLKVFAFGTVIELHLTTINQTSLASSSLLQIRENFCHSWRRWRLLHCIIWIKSSRVVIHINYPTSAKAFFGMQDSGKTRSYL